jgi:hypothetical protein
VVTANNYGSPLIIEHGAPKEFFAVAKDGRTRALLSQIL